ncbi:MAG: hypothetical protein ACRC0L_08100 [Angustibacter sp.]
MTDDRVAVRISELRLGPYLTLQPEVSEALRLYRCSMALNGAFLEDLGLVEVVLRNTVDHCLQTWHEGRFDDGTWLDDSGNVLGFHRRRDIASARRRLIEQKGKVPASSSRHEILTELSFGFWRFLFTKAFEKSLWTPVLRHGFPHLRPARRSFIGHRLDRLTRLRNRVAHHEPTFNNQPWERHADMLEVLGAICPHTRHWVAENSRVPQALAALLAEPGIPPAPGFS